MQQGCFASGCAGPAQSHRITGATPSDRRLKRLRDALRTRGSCFTAELNLRQCSSAKAVIDRAKALCEVVDAVHISDLQGFSGHALSSLLLGAGVDPVLQLSAGNKTPAAIETEMLGALSIGVTSLLVVKAEAEESNQKSQVNAKQMIGFAKEIREDFPEADYMIGTVAPVFRPRAGWKPKSLLERVDAGANFIRTRFCLDASQLASWVEFLVRAQITWQASLIVALPVLQSAKGARWLKENMKRVKVPSSLIQRLEQAQDPELEGVQIAAELLCQYKSIPGVAGVSLMTPGSDSLIVEAIKASGLLTEKGS